MAQVRWLERRRRCDNAGCAERVALFACAPPADSGKEKPATVAGAGFDTFAMMAVWR
jgi:hypothetical protein